MTKGGKFISFLPFSPFSRPNLPVQCVSYACYMLSCHVLVLSSLSHSLPRLVLTYPQIFPNDSIHDSYFFPAIMMAGGGSSDALGIVDVDEYSYYVVDRDR